MKSVAGYSGTPLIKKLGITPGYELIFIGAPENYAELLGPLPPGTKPASRLKKDLDFIHFFTKQRGQLDKRFPSLKKSLAFTGMLWVSWPKKASKVETDLNENIIREIGLAHGLVDVKVVAIDEVWSGLKFVYRLEDRPA